MITYTPTLFQYRCFVWIWIVIGLVAGLYLLRREAPYGRFSTKNWGPMINNRLGWILMEATVMVTLALWIPFPLKWPPMVLFMLILFGIHYVHRSLIYPFIIRTRNKKMPLIVMLSAFLFNTVNGSLLGVWFFRFADYPADWFTSPMFIVGVLLFVIGLAINWTADYQLIRLRQKGETGYKIPYVGLFNYVSSPNLFGEIMEWGGFALLTWSLPGLAFFIWTCANLIPRAISNHRWYKKTFSAYPANRKILIPFLW